MVIQSYIIFGVFLFPGSPLPVCKVVTGVFVLRAVFAFNACNNSEKHSEGDGHNHGTETETATVIRR